MEHYRQEYEKSLEQTAPAAPSPTLEVLPSSFARSDYSKRAQFLSFGYSPGLGVVKEEADGNASEHSSSGEDSDKRKAAQAVRKRFHSFSELVSFRDPIPTAHHEGSLPPRWQNKPAEFRGVMLIEKLRALFAIIPGAFIPTYLFYFALILYAVLSKQQIVELLQLQGRLNLFKDCLPYAAYSFKNGPFAHLWVRFGYDPLRDMNSWIFQSFHVKFSNAFLMDVSSK